MFYQGEGDYSEYGKINDQPAIQIKGFQSTSQHDFFIPLKETSMNSFTVVKEIQEYFSQLMLNFIMKFFLLPLNFLESFQPSSNLL